ncbi:hypothetical protein HGM15179_019761 [Zosterops borbonicus]|uniref:Retroviral nucleocapsid Gag protein p24 C-terminal domain-containing protein n=1 Tax=Zosterops borbonicus TaxID=364589 RepID=A0A8K1D926_9PASS|nr:hypothetical protein HGM15179_019761 [Zosterops borbonicus]
MHQLSQSLAFKAILLVPDKKKALPYASIKQGPGESYSQFIDRLAAALKDAPDLTEEVQDELFRTLAFDNANSRTRTILATLPQGSPVDEMLVRATRAEQNSQNAAFMATMHDAIKQQGHILAAALTKEESRGRTCERNNYADTKVSEGGRGDAPGIRAEILLHPVVKTMVKQAVPLQPMEIHMDAEVHLQPMEETHTRGVGYPRRGCDPMGDPRHEGPMLEQPVLEGLHPVEE